MKQKLLDLLSKLKPIALNLYGKSPLLVGLCIGYFGHDLIKVGINLSAKLVSLLIG